MLVIDAMRRFIAVELEDSVQRTERGRRYAGFGSTADVVDFIGGRSHDGNATLFLGDTSRSQNQKIYFHSIGGCYNVQLSVRIKHIICKYDNFVVYMNRDSIDNKTRSKDPWEETAKRMLKVELVRKGISHERLSELLGGIGVEISKSAIDSKLSRGTFSAAFLLQCLTAIECKKMMIDPE